MGRRRHRARRHAENAETEGRVIVWVDDAGFSLLLSCVRTHVPRGRTPMLRAKLTREHPSEIAAVAETGNLYKLYLNV